MLVLQQKNKKLNQTERNNIVTQSSFCRLDDQKSAKIWLGAAAGGGAEAQKQEILVFTVAWVVFELTFWSVGRPPLSVRLLITVDSERFEEPNRTRPRTLSSLYKATELTTWFVRFPGVDSAQGGVEQRRVEHRRVRTRLQARARQVRAHVTLP